MLGEPQRQELSFNTRSSTLSALTSKFAGPKPCLHFPFMGLNIFFEGRYMSSIRNTSGPIVLRRKNLIFNSAMIVHLL